MTAIAPPRVATAAEVRILEAAGWYHAPTPGAPGWWVRRGTHVPLRTTDEALDTVTAALAAPALATSPTGTPWIPPEWGPRITAGWIALSALPPLLWSGNDLAIALALWGALGALLGQASVGLRRTTP